MPLEGKTEARRLGAEAAGEAGARDRPGLEFRWKNCEFLRTIPGAGPSAQSADANLPFREKRRFRHFAEILSSPCGGCFCTMLLI